LVLLLHSSSLNYGAHGTSLDRDALGESGAGLVRREVQKVTDFQSIAPHGSSAEVVSDRAEFFKKRRSADLDDCNENFVVGPASVVHGQCSSDHEHIITEELCEDAADAVNVQWMGETARILDPNLGNINTHPKGCYSKTVAGVVTYHFNGVPDEIPTPHIEDGEAAVCRRDKLKLGTVNTNTCSSSEYKILFNRDICKEAATCLRYMHHRDTNVGTTEGMDFDVTVEDVTNHGNFPAGCFVHPTEEHEVYYNPDKVGDTTLPLPANPQGTIICIAESVDLSSGGISTADDNTTAGSGGE